MRLVLGGIVLLVCAAALWPQAPPAQAVAQGQPAGLETEWDIGAVLLEIGAHAGRLIPVLDKIDVKAWIAKGASDTYQSQLQSSREQAKALADGARALARSPERLSASIELFFRIQGIETMLGSLEGGLRKYQDPALAQALASLEAENGANRDRLRRYIVNLATQREQEYEVMDREAQRCRGMVFAAPAAHTSGKKK